MTCSVHALRKHTQQQAGVAVVLKPFTPTLLCSLQQQMLNKKGVGA
jgi:hypothetical protein